MGDYVKKKKDMIFQSVDSMQQVVNVINEAASALNDKTRTIKESAIPEVLAGALGAGIGGVASFTLLYGLGTVGLSAMLRQTYYNKKKQRKCLGKTIAGLFPVPTCVSI